MRAVLCTRADCAPHKDGEMAEWLKAAVLKTVREPVSLGGSNPSLSAKSTARKARLCC